MKIKKFIKEIIYIALAVFVVTNVIGYFRGSSVNTSSLELLSEQTSINGKSVKKLIDSNKTLVVNFWGTWCPICMRELSTIENLSKRDDIVLITVANQSGNNKELKEFMQKRGLDYIVVNDNDGKLTKAFKISTFPTNIFYSKDRKNSIVDSGYISEVGFNLRVKAMDSK